MRTTSGEAEFIADRQTPNYRRYVHQQGNKQFIVYFPLGYNSAANRIPMIVTLIENEDMEVDNPPVVLDIHTRTAATMFGVSADDVTPEMRARAKTINWSTLYSTKIESQGLLVAILQELRKLNTREPLIGHPVKPRKTTTKKRTIKRRR